VAKNHGDKNQYQGRALLEEEGEEGIRANFL
jgi:hypothetical protein